MDTKGLLEATNYIDYIKAKNKGSQEEAPMFKHKDEGGNASARNTGAAGDMNMMEMFDDDGDDDGDMYDDGDDAYGDDEVEEEEEAYGVMDAPDIGGVEDSPMDDGEYYGEEDYDNEDYYEDNDDAYDDMHIGESKVEYKGKGPDLSEYYDYLKLMASLLRENRYGECCEEKRKGLMSNVFHEMFETLGINYDKKKDPFALYNDFAKLVHITESLSPKEKINILSRLRNPANIRGLKKKG